MEIKKVDLEDDTSNLAKIYISVSFLLEDQIISSLQLSRLGILKLNDANTERLLGNIGSLNFKSKKDGIKNNFILYWRAGFITKAAQIPQGFKKTYKMSFITSTNLSKNEVEKHLLTYARFKPAANAPEYGYLRGSLESVGGRMYKT